MENVVQANLQAFEAPGVAGMAFNLGTGGRYTLNETLRLLEKFAGRAANANYTAPRPGDIRDSQSVRDVLFTPVSKKSDQSCGMRVRRASSSKS